MRKKLFSLLLLLFCTPAAYAQRQADAAPPVRRCVNMGNMLEAPNEGDWGLVVQETFFQTIADAGFDSIRLPVKWSAHAEADAPYSIDPAFLARVDEVIGWARAADLRVVLNVHHYDEMAAEPEMHAPRLVGLWGQIAAHYADYPDALIFEALNEPNSALTTALWGKMFPQVLAVIRQTNPDRLVVTGGGFWNSLDSLPEMEFPDDDHLMATFHYYQPFEFTHQGAEWVQGMDVHLGTTWGSDAEQQQVEEHMRRAAAWSAETGIPLLLGEFGAYSRADMDSRLRWTTAVRQSAEANNIGWCYWEFASGFGIFDAGRRTFNALLGALIPAE